MLRKQLTYKNRYATALCNIYKTLSHYNGYKINGATAGKGKVYLHKSLTFIDLAVFDIFSSEPNKIAPPLGCAVQGS